MADEKQDSGPKQAPSPYDSSLFDRLVDKEVAKARPTPAEPLSHPMKTRSEALAEREIKRRFAVTAKPGYWTALEDNAAIWARELTASAAWTEANALVSEWSREYFRLKNSALLPFGSLGAFSGKTNPRIRQKVAAMVTAKDFDPSSFSGPIPPIKDLVRIRIATSYLDGVSFLTERLIRHFEKHSFPVAHRTQARATGYYATHLTFPYDLLFRFETPEKVQVQCEVQIATELATTIWDRTHGAYELARVSAEPDDSWQWDPNDPRFIAGQLAHMIHLADGLVVQLREAVSKRKAAK